MIIDNLKGGNVEVIGEESKSASIDVTQVGKLWYMLTEGLYSDAEAAVITELSNNGVDSIVESGKDPITNPVIVRLDGNGYQGTLTIEDRGLGMSKDFFENTFMSLLTSTKGGSNNLIGAFGLGGKSWASLHRSVQFTCIKDGKKVVFFCYKGDTKIMHDILSEEDTTEENGVIFSMPVQGYSEYTSFRAKAIRQLSYYDTVIFLENGKIEENKIYREKDFQFCDRSPYSTMHMCLKDVVYPLDFVKLGISRIDLPIALRFGLDQGINVNPSREMILYSKETIELIKKKIADVSSYFLDKYEERIAESIDFYDNYESIGSSVRNVELNGKIFPINALIPFTGRSPKEPFCKDTPLRGAEYYKKNIYNLQEAFIPKMEYAYGVWKTKRLHFNLNSIISYKHKFNVVDEGFIGNYKDFIREKAPSSTYVVLREPSLYWYKRNILAGQPKKDWRALIQEWQGVVKLIMDKAANDYRGLEKTQDYADWLVKHKQWLKDNAGKIPGIYVPLDKKEGDVTISYGRRARLNLGNAYVFEKKVFKISELPRTKGQVIVFDSDDVERASKLQELLVREKIAVIGPREQTKIKTHQFITIKQFMEGNNKPFRRIATSLLISDLLETYKTIYGSSNDIIKGCVQGMESSIDQLRTYVSQNIHDIRGGEVKAAILETAKNLNIWDEEIKYIVDEIATKIETFKFVSLIKVPSSWDEAGKAQVQHFINEVLLYKKKMGKEIGNYQLVEVTPPVELTETQAVNSLELVEEDPYLAAGEEEATVVGESIEDLVTI